VTGLLVAADRSTKIDENTDCFAQADLNTVIVKRSKGPEVVDALLGGSVEVGTLAITPQAFQALQGNRLVVFATIQTADKDIKVIGHSAAGITHGSSLKGKRIGYVGGTYGEIFLSRYLLKHGIKKNDASLTSAPPAQLRDLFISRSLDAIILWEPFIQDILRDPAIKKNEVFLDVDPTVYTGRINLVARPESLRMKRKEAEKLVKALICGETLLRKNPHRAQESIERWLDRKPGTLNNVFDEGSFRIELNMPALLSDLREEIKWAKDAVFNGKGTTPKDLSPFVDPSIMEAVAPNRVKK
jgi:sulfonate transport system substrate-binding protein